MSAQPAIWITGMAWTTALGTGTDEVWNALLAQRSGITRLDAPVPLRGYGAAVIPSIALDLPIQHRQHTLSVTTMQRALADAGLEAQDRRVVAILGTSYGAHLDLADVAALSDWSMAAARAAGCPTQPITITTACSAGSDAIATGLTLLRSGAAQICLCGGADILTLGKRLGHSRLGTLATGDLRAFDRQRDGTVLGEGAAFLVLETAQSATARGIRPHGLVLGAGASSDAASAVAPDTSGKNVALAVARALHNANLRADAVAVVNAHASGTVLNDQTEAHAYAALFATLADKPAGFATKGNFGHTLGATGALEAIAVLLALNTRSVPPIYRLEQPLADAGLTLPIGQAMRIASGVGLSTTLGFGGFNTCLVFAGAEAA